jgi:hypothetical protein
MPIKITYNFRLYTNACALRLFVLAGINLPGGDY